ncbi:MAG: ATP-grasp domain-containing protein [Xanthobacteraceae bacterium]
MHMPLACVLGSMDMVRPLGLAGIRCAVVARPGAPSLYSRFTEATLCRHDFSAGDQELVETLVRFGAGEPQRPVLFYEEDAQLLLVSRHRERLAEAFRFVIAGRELVEDLVDKSRFCVLAQQLGLPVPATRTLDPAGEVPAELGLRFPIVVKPLMRTPAWDVVAKSHKALEVATPAALQELWPALVALGSEVLAQEWVPGPESRIESYHVYVDAAGSIAAEFTGRKIRTHPETCGHSTALEISDAADVRAQGRAAMEKLKLTGVAKFDFKRGPDGRLHLLEINPRFNLWHHLGAVAGLNMPALVYADLLGRPRPTAAPARAGARWCSPWKDLSAAREAGVPLWRWIAWMLRCEAKSAIAWDDPMPLLGGVLSRCLPQRHGVGAAARFQLSKQAG